MGVVGIDLKLNEYRLEMEYPLDTPQGVNALLSNYHYVRSAAIDKGDFDAINMLIDFEIAYSKIKVTKRQRQAVQLVYFADLTQKEAGAIMGISQQAVQQLLNTFVKNISAQYRNDMSQVEVIGNVRNLHE